MILFDRYSLALLMSHIICTLHTRYDDVINDDMGVSYGKHERNQECVEKG
jgi:hypothetical protein